MGTRHADRIWLLAGAVAVAVLVIASWFLLISPKNAEIDEVNNQSADTQTQLIALRKRINELEQEKAKLPATVAALNKKKLAMPSDSGVPAFLRQLQASGTATNVDVTGLAVNTPVQMTTLPSVWALPITLTAAGTVADLESFLTTLQTGQSRAVLIQKANFTPDSGSSSSTSGMSLSLSLTAYVAPAAGSGTPAVTTK
jgi:Tfp pilus assembly protein PilO